MFTACSLARPLSGLFLVVADVQVFFWHSPYSAPRQYFMPVSISFISLARFWPGPFLTFFVFDSSAIFHARFDFVHLSGPFQARSNF